MKKKLIVSILFLSHMTSLASLLEYFYPIGLVPDGAQDKVLCAYQDTTRKLHAILYDASTQQYISVLSTQYNPIGMQLLPDGSGFSFVDNGIIKIKQFNKRSPKIVEIYEPLYAIANLTWDSNKKVCVFQAKRNKTFGIYSSTIDGDVTPLAIDSTCDLLYPVVAKEALFFIKKNHENLYSLVSKNLVTQEIAIVAQSLQPLAYISAFDSENGIFMSYDMDQNQSLEYKINYFSKNGIAWHTREIFEGRVPTDYFFDNNNSLCEVLRPFIPHFHGQMLFLPIRESSLPNILSYYLAKKNSLGGFMIHEKFFPISMVHAYRVCINASPTFFGSPYILQDGYLVGTSWRNFE